MFSYDNGSKSMRIFYGICQPYNHPDESPVMGRLVLECDTHQYSTKEALISIVDANGCADVTDNTVGVIRISDEEHCLFTSGAYIPCPEIILSHLPRECIGKIALLDPTARRLFVSPDLNVVNQYVGKIRMTASQKADDVLVLPRYNCVSRFCRPSEGCLLEYSPIVISKDEEEIFDFYRRMAEYTTSASVTVSVNTRSEFLKTVRAIYRSAVYGNISMMFRGILNGNELTKALSDSHKAFCELEDEGREFNGYIPRGLCVDTPFLLYANVPASGLDFLVFDMGRIIYLSTGGATTVTKEIKRDILKNVSLYKNQNPNITTAAILGNTVSDTYIRQTLIDIGITLFYTDRRATPVEIFAHGFR